MVEIRRGVKAAGGIRERLNDSIVIGRIVVAQIVAIEQINLALLAGTDQQVLPGQTVARFVRQYDRSTCTEVQILAIQVRLIERREIVHQSEPVGGGEFQNAIAEGINLRI